MNDPDSLNNQQSERFTIFLGKVKNNILSRANYNYK